MLEFSDFAGDDAVVCSQHEMEERSAWFFPLGLGFGVFSYGPNSDVVLWDVRIVVRIRPRPRPRGGDANPIS